MNETPILARPRKDPPEREPLFELTEQLDAGGTAAAYRMYWDGADYVADESIEYEVRDLMGCHWGLKGERVSARSRRMPDDASHVWEVTRGGAPWYEGTLDEALSFDGTAEASVTIHGDSKTVTVTDRFLSAGGSLDSASRIGFVYDVQNGRLVVTEAPC